VSGRAIAGAADVADNAPSVAFTETLRHLSASVGKAALNQRLAPVARRASTAVVAVTLICLFMVALAIAVQLKANALYRDLLQRQREFTARVTHELKTPLAGIRVMAENLASGAFRDEKQITMAAQRIVDEADRLTARVNEVLAVGRKREIEEPVLFDLEEPMLELVDIWGPRYEQAGIRLIADLAPVDPFLGDPSAIRDAVGQLLDNALKYRREETDSQVWLNVIDEEKIVLIEVVDNGMGVPADQRKRIFEQYVRVEGPNRGKSGGHGLGLSQVEEIVRAHGGTITCEDGVDGGARFVVRLPARRPRAA
jgi:signal transduction histidine kinase